MPTAEILSTGDEVVTGQTVDTNAAWIAEQLTELGFDVPRHTTVGDRMADLVAVMREIAGRCDVCIVTGGLGPTDDDLTAQAVSEAFGWPLALDPDALAQIEGWFRKFDRKMASINRKQAILPVPARRLDNDWGTAPGFAFDTAAATAPQAAGSRAFVACLPGVPREMKQMMAHRVEPELRARFALRPGRLVMLRTLGIGESDLQVALGDWQAEGVVVGFRTQLPENHLKLRFSPDVPEDTVMDHVRTVLDRVGRWTFTIEGLPRPIDGYDAGGGTPAAVVGRLLAARRQTLALAESCTGGRIAAACTSIPGASDWLLEGLVTYANAAKVRLLGVTEPDLAEHGAVSEVVARAMADGVRRASGADWSIGVTGIAGPGGGTPDKPVGTVHIAIAGPDGASVHRGLRFPGDRDRIQSFTVAAALELLRRELVHPPTGK